MTPTSMRVPLTVTDATAVTGAASASLAQAFARVRCAVDARSAGDLRHNLATLGLLQDRDRDVSMRDGDQDKDRDDDQCVTVVEGDAGRAVTQRLVTQDAVFFNSW
jgi:hypothetical protein